jgi:hypothetical protein
MVLEEALQSLGFLQTGLVSRLSCLVWWCDAAGRAAARHGGEGRCKLKYHIAFITGFDMESWMW